MVQASNDIFVFGPVEVLTNLEASRDITVSRCQIVHGEVGHAETIVVFGKVGIIRIAKSGAGFKSGLEQFMSAAEDFHGEFVKPKLALGVRRA